MNLFIKVSLLLLISSCSFLSSLKFEGVRAPKNNLKVAWAKNLDPVHNTGNLPVGLQSPFIYEGIVYVGAASGAMNAYNTDDGRLLWSKKSTGGYHSAAMIYKEQLVYGTAAGRVFSRHYLTGEKKFEVDLDAPIESQAVVYRDRLFFQTRNHKLFCLDATTGRILWSYRRSVPYLTTVQRVSRPFIEKNRLYVGFADGNVAAFNIEDGVILWERKISFGGKFIDVDVSPLKVGKKIYAGSIAGSLTELNSDTGALHRTFPYSISRSPILIDKKLVFGTNQGQIVMMDKFGKELLKKKVSKSSITSLKKWKSGLAIGTSKGEVLFVDSGTFNIINKRHLGNTYSAVFGDIEVKSESMAVLSSRNRLYLFR